MTEREQRMMKRLGRLQGNLMKMAAYVESIKLAVYREGERK